MFLIPDKKIAVVWNPRTGSQTHHKMLWKKAKDRIFISPEIMFLAKSGYEDGEYVCWEMNKFHLHVKRGMLQELYPTENLDEYRVLAFYRNPIERFLSIAAYRGNEGRHDGEFHPRMSPRAYAERCEDILYLQSTHLDVPNIELFDFDDFERETVRFFGELGVEISLKDIPKDDSDKELKDNRRSRAELRDKEIAQIHKYWAEDYKFFESKGIEFH